MICRAVKRHIFEVQTQMMKLLALVYFLETHSWGGEVEHWNCWNILSFAIQSAQKRKLEQEHIFTTEVLDVWFTQKQKLAQSARYSSMLRSALNGRTAYVEEKLQSLEIM